MTYRKFDNETWQDPWFEMLSPNAKLAFIYFWTNKYCNQAGVYEISERRAEFDLGYRIDTISEELEPKVILYPDLNIVWVRNFFRHQCQNGKFAISAINSIKDDPFKLKLFIGYNRGLLEGYKIDLSGYSTDTIPIQYPAEQNRTEQNRTDIDFPLESHPSSEEPDHSDQSPKPPSGAPVGDFSFDTSINQEKHRGHFSILVGQHFKAIKESCDAISKFPSLRGKRFNPFQWVQKHVNEKRHPGAIAETISALTDKRLFSGIRGDPFAYANSILTTKNQNWNERDAVAIHDELKTLDVPALKDITAGLFERF